MRLRSVAVLLLAACSVGDSANGNSPEGAQSANAPASAAVPAGDSATRKSILVVGTSLTAGLGIDPDSAWPAFLQRKLDSAGMNYVVRNAGLSGETSAGALRRIDWLLRDSAHMVLIETGANDGLRGLNPDSTRANIRGIVAAVRARLPKARIVLLGMQAPPNMGADYASRFNAIYPELANSEKLQLVPFLLEGVAGDAKLNQSDGIHPNPLGARIIAGKVYGEVVGGGDLEGRDLQRRDVKRRDL